MMTLKVSKITSLTSKCRMYKMQLFKYKNQLIVKIKSYRE